MFGSKSTTLAACWPLFGVSITTPFEPATTWALVTKYPAPSGQDDPASAPPPHPEAITFDVTPTASRIPAVSTSGGIATGAGGMFRIVEKGFGKWPGRNRLPTVARNPGGRGMNRSSDCSMLELLICLSRVIQGLCTNIRPRYQVVASADSRPSPAPTAESTFPSSAVCSVRCRIRNPIPAPIPSMSSVTPMKTPIAKSVWVVRSWVIALAIGGAITAPRKSPARSPASARATPVSPRRSPETANPMRKTTMTMSRMSTGEQSAVAGSRAVAASPRPGWTPLPTAVQRLGRRVLV